jgi:ABC-2 type transport system permease protein
MTSAPATTADNSRLAVAPAHRPPAHTSRIAALWTLYTLTLRQYLHGKRWLAMIALFLLPVGLAIVVRVHARHPSSVLLEFLAAFMFVPQALLPLIALLYASGIIQDEQEEQTITYLLVRPIPKWAIYCMKLFATWTIAVALTIVLTVLTYAAIYTSTDVPLTEVVLRCTKAALVHSLAVVAYCSLFGLISFITRRTLLVGIIYAAVVEGLFANLPFGIRLATVIYYTRLIAFRMMEFVVTYSHGAPENVAATVWQFDVERDPKLLEHPSTGVCLLVLLISSLVCTIVAAWLCSQREFHVKVPEGN